MKKDYRVKKNEEFQYILKNGESFANRQLVIYYVKKKDQRHFRVGISVGKKLGNAVLRNRIKRHIREAFMFFKDEIQPEYDLIVIARNPTKNMSSIEIRSSLEHVLKRTKLIK